MGSTCDGLNFLAWDLSGAPTRGRSSMTAADGVAVGEGDGRIVGLEPIGDDAGEELAAGEPAGP